ncbi:hypothetical protein [Chitinophaga sp.]|uniref:hypothetical protein n=1 Tax=Chitinophaga sp. TaxID=1869181 RepID=UPI0031D72B19
MAKSAAMIWRAASGSVGKELTITTKRSGSVQIGKHRKASTVAPTESQLDVREKFKLGVIYAKAAMDNPDLKAQYQAAALRSNKDQSAYNLAVRDAAMAPEIRSITTAAYTGAIGSTISVKAIDDFKVATVTVKITSAAGVVIEQGNAILQKNGLDWLYTATAQNDALQGSTITVSATDLPANETVQEVVL